MINEIEAMKAALWQARQLAADRDEAHVLVLLALAMRVAAAAERIAAATERIADHVAVWTDEDSGRVRVENRPWDA